MIPYQAFDFKTEKLTESDIKHWQKSNFGNIMFSTTSCLLTNIDSGVCHDFMYTQKKHAFLKQCMFHFSIFKNVKKIVVYSVW